MMECRLAPLAEACQKTGWQGPCLLPDAQPLSSGSGNTQKTQRQPGGRHGFAPWHLHHPTQSPAQAHRSRAGRYKAQLVQSIASTPTCPVRLRTHFVRPI